MNFHGPYTLRRTPSWPRHRCSAHSANGSIPALTLCRDNGAQSGYGLMNQPCQRFSGGPRSSRAPSTTFVHVAFLLDLGSVRRLRARRLHHGYRRPLDAPGAVPATPAARRPRPNLRTAAWRVSRSSVEVYRLSRVGIDQADRLRRAGGGGVAHHLVGIDLRLDRAGSLLLVQDEPARCEGHAHGRAYAHVLVDGDLPARHDSPHRTGSSRRLWIAIPGLNSRSLAGTASRSPGSRPIKPRKASWSSTRAS